MSRLNSSCRRSSTASNTGCPTRRPSSAGANTAATWESPESGAREIIAVKPLRLGELRARGIRAHFDVANTEIRLQRNPNGPGGFQLLIDRQPAHAWFRQRYVELMTRLGYPVRPERPVIRRHTIKR